MKTYEELYEKWHQMLNRDGGVYVEILGVNFNIEEIGKNDDKIDMTLIPTTSLSKCYLIVTYEEFEGLLNSIEWKPMGKVAKIKYLLDMLLENFAGTLQFSIVRNSISPILVSACVDLPETYPDGTTVSDEEVKKAVDLFHVRLERIKK